MKHPETIEVFTTTLQELDIDLYGHVYPNIPKHVASLVKKRIDLEDDETILYVNLNKEKEEGIVITDIRFIRWRGYSNFRNWSEITIEYGNSLETCVRFLKLEDNVPFGFIEPYEFDPPIKEKEEEPEESSINYSKIAWDVTKVVGKTLLRTSGNLGRIASYALDDILKGVGSDEDKEFKIRQMKAHCLFELFSRMIDSQQKSNEKEAVSKSNRVELDLLSCSDLRAEALNALQGNWKKAIFVTFIYMSVNVVLNYTLCNNGQFLMFLLFYILLANPIFYGYRVYALDLCREEVGRVGALFDGFRDYKRVVLTLILKDVYILLWSLLLVVPGLVKSYSYAMTVFIMKDHPEMAYNEAIEESMAMMDGHKKKLFLLDLSFIGWILLCVLSFGILLIFVTPYMSAAHATFYENLKEQK